MLGSESSARGSSPFHPGKRSVSSIYTRSVPTACSEELTSSAVTARIVLRFEPSPMMPDEGRLTSNISSDLGKRSAWSAVFSNCRPCSLSNYFDACNRDLRSAAKQDRLRVAHNCRKKQNLTLSDHNW